MGRPRFLRNKEKMEMEQATLKLDIQFDPAVTDAESVAGALDMLLEMAMSTPGILDEYGDVRVDEFLVGLVNLTDELADQAHDRHGIDCLLDSADGLCDCEKPGFFCSGVPGILAHMENGCLAAGTKVERCDQCQRYPTDEAALAKLQELGYASP
jgi:hypothetical protein